MADTLQGTRDEIAGSLELDPCCREAFNRITDAWLAETIGPEVATDLGHGGAGPAFLELLHASAADPAAVGAWADRLTTEAPPTAGSLLVGAWAAEQNGDVAAAEALLTRASELDPRNDTVAGDRARYLTERNDVVAAIRVLRDAGLDDDPLLSLLESLRLEMAALYRDVSRNDPCPCGSGRKFKHCHQRGGLDLIPRHRMLLLSVKLHLWLSGPDHRDRVPELARLSGREDLDEALGDPVFADFAVWEGGLVDEYLARRGDLLDETDRTALTAAKDRPRQLHEVVEHDPVNGTIRLRALPEEEDVIVDDDEEWDHEAGDLVAVRLAEIEGTPVRTGLAVAVASDARDDAIAFLAAGPDDEALARWYGETLR